MPAWCAGTRSQSEGEEEEQSLSFPGQRALLLEMGRERAERASWICFPVPWQAKCLWEEGELLGEGSVGGVTSGSGGFWGAGMSECAGGQCGPCLPPADKCKTLTLTSYFFHLKITHYQCSDDYSEPQFTTLKAKLRMCITGWQGSMSDHAQWLPVSYQRAFQGQRDLRMVFQPGYWSGEGYLDFEHTWCVMAMPMQFALGCCYLPYASYSASICWRQSCKTGEDSSLHQLRSAPRFYRCFCTSVNVGLLELLAALAMLLPRLVFLELLSCCWSACLCRAVSLLLGYQSSE